jgi:uncharacterized RmlC-like cupin family protein
MVRNWSWISRQRRRKMKRTKVIDRTKTAKNETYEKGVITECMVSKDTCTTTKLLGTYVVIPPGSKSPMRYHKNAELAWYLVKGHIKQILLVGEEKKRIENECGTGAAGYVAPGDAHQEINLSDTKPAEMVLAYAHPKNEDCNSLECLGTVFCD